MAPSVLIVDDTALFRTSIRHAVQDAGYRIAGTARNGEQALLALNTLKPEAIILDLEMPGMNGIEFLTALRADRSIFRPQVILVFSAHSQRAAGITMDALRLGATDFVAKPSGGAAAITEMLIPKLNALLNHNEQTKGIGAVGTSATDYKTPRNIIAIASSTGGPQALTKALSPIPASFPVPIIVTQHMPPVFTASFAQTLNAACPCTVVEASQSQVLEPGTIYIAPGDYHLTLRKRPNNSGYMINLTQEERIVGLRPAADIMYRSARELFGANFLAAIFTGMGQDGTDGLRNPGATGFACITQTAQSCVVYGMPRAVDEAGLAQEHFTPENFYETLQSYTLAWK